MKTMIWFYFFLMLAWGCSSSQETRLPEWEGKMDARLRLEMDRLRRDAAATSQRLAVLVKFQAPLTPAQQQALQERQVTVLSTIGAIATAVLPASAIPELAKLDYVIYIELSREHQLRPEAGFDKEQVQ